MTLEIKVQNIINNFEDTASDEFLEILEQIMLEFKSNLTVEYLKGKIKKIVELSSESEKKKQCKLLLPYYDWYLQGL
ncbi:hypothetical protein OAI55_00150 [Nitrosopumilus sp.]|nr:hypothetical protein [Nitrosopumilus sp.]MCH1549370.1 hypothetical protein [Nitrosopumilus sp.]MDC0173440.1 hypothetical protein [Nitrosopumilus sp.]RCL30710.1 MAG: hypothetical protein DBX08_05825 [Nitrosopumilus sp.]|tara:strand:- start:4209 stop:4439 length:231 start_codon:yes stop_codon:yes gene_type:complete